MIMHCVRKRPEQKHSNLPSDHSNSGVLTQWTGMSAIATPVGLFSTSGSFSPSWLLERTSTAADVSATVTDGDDSTFLEPSTPSQWLILSVSFLPASLFLLGDVTLLFFVGTTNVFLIPLFSFHMNPISSSSVCSSSCIIFRAYFRLCSRRPGDCELEIIANCATT